MLDVRRVGASAAFLALTAICTSTFVWGEPGREKSSKELADGRNHLPGKGDRFADKLATSRYTDQPFVVYETTKGERLFAAQIKPALEAAPARARDILVLVDTSASKAQGPLVLAQKLTEILATDLGDDDRMAVWTVNTEPRNLTRDWKARGKLGDALKELAKEYPSGAVNLKKGVEEAVKSFDAIAGRQKVILFLGDGKSLAGPLDDDGRADLCASMVKEKIGFFAVPLGTNVDFQNLHGLVNGTGGKVVRVIEAENGKALIQRFNEATAVPVLYPEAVQLPAEVAEAMPAKLPPLRADSPTLLVGKLSKAIDKFDYTVSGSVAGKEKRLTASLKVPAADNDNYFLVQMVNQWHGQKDRASILPADRTLAFAHDQNFFAMNDLLAQAQWAMDENKFDYAAKLFSKALNLDPRSTEAKGGLDVVQQLRDGKLTRDQIARQFAPKPGEKLVRLAGNNAVKEVSREEVLKQDDPKADQPKPVEPLAPPLAPPIAPPDDLRDFKARQAVNNQAAARLVEEAMLRASRLVRSQPDAAHEYLKQTLDGIRTNPDISPATQLDLSQRLATSLQQVDREGVTVKRSQADILQALSIADARRASVARTEVRDSEIRERLRVFHKLMNEARDAEAFDVAKTIRENLIDRGEEIPQAVTAAYVDGLRSYNLKELNKIRLVREEKWLAVMLNVEESHIPFPDEPPVEYPSPAVVRRLTKGKFSNWSDWSTYRIEKYDATSLGSNIPEKAFLLRKRLGIVVPKYSSTYGATLKDHLDYITDKYSGDRNDGVNVNLSFDIYDKAFAAEAALNVLGTDFTKTEWTLYDVTLSSVLKKLISQITLSPSSPEYLIRRDQIEITTSKMAAYEKTIRVYPVADLVIPLGNNQFFGPGANLAGGGGLFGIPGGGGQFGQFGGQFGGGQFGGGQFGGGQFGGGQFGGGQFGGGQFGGGQFGGGQFGGQFGGGQFGGGQFGGGQFGGGQFGGGQFGGGQFGGQFGGGQFGGGQFGGGQFGGGQFGGGQFGGGQFGGGQFGGGQFGGGQFGGGQFGGGQFGGGGGGQFGGQFGGGGFGGGNLGQGQFLQTLIRQVVGKPSDWTAVYDPFTGQPLIQIDPTTGLPVTPPPGQDPLTGGENNNIGFYPPAQALVVKGPSRITGRYRPPYPAVAGGGGPLTRADDKQRDVAFVPRDPNTKVLGNNDRIPRTLDAKVVWQDALVKAQADNPSLIIAVADFLGMQGKWEDCSEFLKANLRIGIVVKPWVYETLAIALKESGGSTEEIERAEVSVVDLQPANATGFLRASQAMADHKRFDRAVAFCRQASILEPNTAAPYAEALMYAEYSQDSKAMEWAAGNLLKQDWPSQSKELQLKAQQKLEALAKTLQDKNRGEDSKRLRDSVTLQRRRDLVIKASFQGEGNVDLKVKEPLGGVCWSLNRQTIGGGTYTGDTIGDLNAQTYTAAEAFSGEYEITVDRVWGHPLGDKVQVRIIRHQGTDDETEQLVTVDLNAKEAVKVKVKLENGRRTETAYVPPPSTQQVPEAVADPVAAANVTDQLRDLASPELFGGSAGFQGGAGAPASRPLPSGTSAQSSSPSADDRVLYQNKVATFMKQSMDVTAQAVLSGDRRTVRLSVTPQFTPGSVNGTQTVINNPAIPGGKP